jgi:hypothetical protein
MIGKQLSEQSQNRAAKVRPRFIRLASVDEAEGVPSRAIEAMKT